MSDTKILEWLESRFTGKWKNSIFIATDQFGEGMLVMDERKTAGVVHRAKTIRGLIKLAMEHERSGHE